MDFCYYCLVYFDLKCMWFILIWWCWCLLGRLSGCVLVLDIVVFVLAVGVVYLMLLFVVLCIARFGCCSWFWVCLFKLDDLYYTYCGWLITVWIDLFVVFLFSDAWLVWFRFVFVLILFIVLWLLLLLIFSCVFAFAGLFVNSVVYCCFSFLSLVVKIYVCLFVLEIRVFVCGYWLVVGVVCVYLFEWCYLYL